MKKSVLVFLSGFLSEKGMKKRYLAGMIAAAAVILSGFLLVKNTQNKTVLPGHIEGQEYSDEELSLLAREFYGAHSDHGEVPEFIEVTEAAEGMVNIQLYDIVEDHGVTRNWYTVDRKTARGYDINFEEVDLTRP